MRKLEKELKTLGLNSTPIYEILNRKSAVKRPKLDTKPEIKSISSETLRRAILGEKEDMPQ